jgi:hypothetical protein
MGVVYPQYGVDHNPLKKRKKFVVPYDPLRSSLMNQFTALLRSALAVMVMAVLASGAVIAQDVKEQRGTMGLVEGRQYMVAFPQVWASPSEKPMPKPMVLFISSKSDAKVKISTPSDINQNARINAEYNVKKNQVLTVPIDLPYMNQESQSRNGFGIQVTADKPISVSTYQAWEGNGELARQLPIEAWGRDYFTMNFYQDRYGSQTQGYKYRPGQILIVAAYDNTQVSYRVPWATEGGRDHPSVPKNGSGIVELRKGETFLIKAEIDPAYNKEFTTDLSGTQISASRPIGVISGHTKVAIMRYPDVLPPTGMFSAEAHFVRNNVHDAMLPKEMGGTQFVTVPCMYTPTRVVGQASVEFGIDDDRGDVIRFVALEDNTTIRAMRSDGTGLKTIMKINKGQTWLETSVDVATLWTSDKPMLVGHYGKSYAKILPPTFGIDKDGNQTQGHPTVESGMPMLQYVPPTDRWTNYAVFKSPEGMDNFFNIAFKPEEAGKIKIDGKTLSSAFGGSMRLLQGTPYAFIRTNIGAGDHVVESETDDIKWMAWTYGSLDGLQQGRAYGTPVAIDLSISCDDSLAVKETIFCGDVNAEAKILPEDIECGSIFAIYAESLNNYELVIDERFIPGDKLGKFQVNVLDKTKDAEGTILVISRSGKFVRKTYTYIADKISWDPKSVNFGKIPFNTAFCEKVRFINERTDAPVTVQELRAKYFPGVFSFNPKSFVIPPGQSIEVEVCAMITEPGERIDTIIAKLECYEQLTAELIVRGDEPLIYVSDQNWGKIPATSPGVERSVEIVNSSDVDLIVTGYEKSKLDGSGNFFNPKNLDEHLPITIKPRDKHVFRVTYSPKGVSNVPHREDVVFYSNAKRVDSIAVLQGEGITLDLLAVIEPWNERVIDNIQTQQGITRYTQQVPFYNYGELPVEYRMPVIRGADAGAFEIVDLGNTGGFPIQLVSPAKQSRYITVAFRPDALPNRGAERDDYQAQLAFPTNADDPANPGQKMEVVVDLIGVAWQPQVIGIDHNYGTFQAGDAPATAQLPISNDHFQGEVNPTTGDTRGTHNVTVTGIRFVGGATNFAIKNPPTPANPWVIEPGQQEKISIEFDPQSAGTFTAQYEIITGLANNMTDGAAPYIPVYTLTAVVEGGEFRVEGDSVDQYVMNATEMTIKVSHTDAAARRYRIDLPAGPDGIRFEIIEPSNFILNVPGGQEGIVRVRFIPDYVTKMRNGQTTQWLNQKGKIQGVNWRDNYFKATVDITDEQKGETKTATLAGHGLYLETTNYIPEYNVKVGDPFNVDVRLEGTPENINSVGLNEMRTRISYDAKLIRPATDAEGRIKVILAGTQAEGWTVLKADQSNENSIEIDLGNGPTTLSSTDGRPMFKVQFNSYLAAGSDPDNIYTSPLIVYSYPVDHDFSEVPGVSTQYCVIRDVPGKVTIEQDCAAGTRLVSIGGANFAVQPISPNPASTSALINYSVGIDGRVQIILYNNMGQRVMDIVNASMRAGEYEVSVDFSQVPAGTYYYQVISGPYISDPQVVTVVH